MYYLKEQPLLPFVEKRIAKIGIVYFLQNFCAAWRQLFLVLRRIQGAALDFYLWFALIPVFVQAVRSAHHKRQNTEYLQVKQEYG